MKTGDAPRLRMLTLWVIFLGIVSTLGRLILLPSVQVKSSPLSPKEFIFPNSVELAGWRSLPSHPIDIDQVSITAQPKFLAGHSYQYQQDNQLLAIDMIYAIETNGNLVNFLDDYTTVDPSVVRSPATLQRFHHQTGHYLLFASGQSVYLTSCINPRGKSTITLAQFQRNRYSNDIRPERFFRWFFWSESMRDLRCLWTKLSVPSENQQTGEALLVLEDVWLKWHSWWQDHFPKL